MVAEASPKTKRKDGKRVPPGPKDTGKEAMAATAAMLDLAQEAEPEDCQVATLATKVFTKAARGEVKAPTMPDGKKQKHVRVGVGSSGWCSIEGQFGTARRYYRPQIPQHPSRQPKAAPALGPRARSLRGRVRKRSGSGAGAERACA